MSEGYLRDNAKRFLAERKKLDEGLRPHWPAIRLDTETGQYYTTQILYADTPDFGKKWPALRLMKEWPPVWLKPNVESGRVK